MNKEEYKFDHFKDIDEVMYYFNYWYKEDDYYSIDRYLNLSDFNYISNKYQELQQENKELKEKIDKVLENEEEILYLVNKVAITTQNIEAKAVRDRLEEIFEILKGESDE